MLHRQLSDPMDLITKVKRAVETPGPAFVNVLVPCPLFWKIDPADQMKVCKLAADSRFWPVYEVIDGKSTSVIYPKILFRWKISQVAGTFPTFSKRAGRGWTLLHGDRPMLTGSGERLLKKCAG